MIPKIAMRVFSTKSVPAMPLRAKLKVECPAEGQVKVATEILYSDKVTIETLPSDNAQTIFKAHLAAQQKVLYYGGDENAVTALYVKPRPESKDLKDYQLVTYQGVGAKEIFKQLEKEFTPLDWKPGDPQSYKKLPPHTLNTFFQILNEPKIPKYSKFKN